MKSHLIPFAASLAAILALACASCASTLTVGEIRDLRRHVISADAEGKPIDPVTGEVVYSFPNSVQAMLTQAAVEATARETRNEDEACHFPGHAHKNGYRLVRKLLIHVHGGLNGNEASSHRAVDTLSRIDAEKNGDWSYPIFLTWPSGGLQSVDEHLWRLRFGSHLPWYLGWVASPFVLTFDLIQGIARSPQTLLSMGINDLQVGLNVGFGVHMLPTWKRADAVYETFGHAVGDRALHQENCSVGLRVHLGDFSRPGLKHAYRFTRYIVLLPVKIITTPLFVDGIGKEAWRVMLHRASNTLRPTSEFENQLFDDRTQRDPRAELTAPASGAFAKFFSGLENFLETQSKANPDVCWEITLIGHSMGAIILNDALQLFPKLPVSNIVFMAAACSIGETEEAIVPYLEKNPQTNFFILTLHPLAEAGEVVAADLPSRGSLLEWIDQWFESPDHPLDRRLGKWNNAIDALHVFASVRHQVTLKGFGVRGNSIPQQHGDFNDCPFWRREFWDIDGPERY